MNLTLNLSFLLLVVVGISCTPHGIRKESPTFSQVDGKAEVSSLTALKPRSKKWHLGPVSVTNKDQNAREPHTFSEVKESHSVFSNINGNRHGLKQEHQQVSKNGNLVSKLVHQQTKNAEKGGKPHFEDLTDIDIPELDIHKKIINNDGFEKTIQAKRNSNGPVLPAHSAAELAELAGYVLETGDQASVVHFLERLIEEERISEEEALLYVETIKSYLEEAEKASMHSDDEEEKIREILLERKLEEFVMQQRLHEEEEAKAELMSSLINAEQTENDSIMKINQFLETSLKEGKISNILYNHLKKGLIESVMDGMGQHADGGDMDYGQY